MRLPRNHSARQRFGFGAAVFVAAALVLAATPARAEPATGADLQFHVAGEKVVRNASKPFWLHLRNNGPVAAANVRLTVDISGIDASRVEVEMQSSQDCVTTTTRSICNLGGLGPGETLQEFVVIVKSVAGRGAAGSFTIEVTSSTADPNPTNNKKTTVPVEVVKRAADLSARGFDVYADPASKTAVKPGESADLRFELLNVGRGPVHGVAFTVSLPSYVTFDGVRPGCEYNEANTVVTCVRGRTVRSGEAFLLRRPLRVKVAKDAPGPVALLGGMVSGGAAERDEVPAEPADPAVAVAAADDDSEVRAATEEEISSVDADASDNHAEFSVFTSANPADLAITGGSASGEVGATVDITVNVENKGPASSPFTTVKVTAPSGTELAKVPGGCVIDSASKVATCTGLLSAGEKDTGTFSFKILSGTVGTDGKAEISGTLDDPDESNNTAAITITVTGGGLPITGDRTSVIGGVGLAVLAAGIALFLVTRRRRVVLVTPDEDS